jgi:anhydro-N-acetylmuramic acid kinase
MQIGEGAVIAEMTGRPVVSDFRVADMAAGGRGAPLVPFLDYRLFRHESINRIALNIGGIANITVIPAGARAEDVVAFDTGPGNMIIDALAPPFDRDGALARAGRVNERLLEELLRDPYYRQEPPKTAGREQYGAEFIARTGIDVATATELTVRTIAAAVGQYPATQEVIVSGGGAHNSYMMERLQANIGARLVRSSELGVDVDAKEAVLFALLAYETWHRRAGNVPSATGARRAAVLGKISLR